jgi:hypothetical protein
MRAILRRPLIGSASESDNMGIRDRVQDAEFLWQQGRHEGALLSALSAVAATARLRYPDRKAVKDGDAFKRFLESAHSVRLSVEFRGEVHTIEHIFYKWLRCELVHEGGLPVDIQFMADADPDELSVRAGGKPEFVLKLSSGWFYHLLGAVTDAPENRVTFNSSDVSSN